MNLYRNNSRWKTVLTVIAGFIVLTSLLYANYLVRKIEHVERQKVQLYANTLEKINEADEGEDVDFYFEILRSEKNIPLMAVDEKNQILDFKNLDEEKATDKDWLSKQQLQMKQAYKPIEIDLPTGEKNYYYYKGSPLLYQVKWFPFVQFGTITLFLLSAYYLFNQARKSEQNQVWVGMSKETAHQLGTPISSLFAWVELLKTSDDPEVQDILPDLEKDLNRLDLISDRFSKIGSKPTLEKHEIQEVLSNIFYYMEKRSSKRVAFELQMTETPLYAQLYPALFNWVIENLIKNALDAIHGDGKIILSLEQKGKHAIVKVTDTGKGITHRNKNIVFRPGFSTKKRGWGLGLSLSKRIIEEYHKGKLFVLHSQKDVGTTFQIEIDCTEN